MYDELYDEDLDSINFDSLLLNDIKRLANTFIQNIGVNNKVAKDALNEIRSFMQEKGFSECTILSLILHLIPRLTY